MAHRLLYTSLPVLPRWDQVRHIAARLARDDENSDDTYPVYVKRLCVLKGLNRLYLADACTNGPDLYGSKRNCGGSYCEFDLVSAAAFLNKLSIIDEVANSDHRLGSSYGLFPSPYRCAIEGENPDAIRLLFQKLDNRYPRSSCAERRRLFISLPPSCSTAMAKLIMPVWNSGPLDWEDDWEGNRGGAVRAIDRALSTSHVDMFDFLMELKKNSPHPDLEEEELLELLRKTCYYCSLEKAQRLLSLGAPVEGDDDSRWRPEDPLELACKRMRAHSTQSQQEAFIRLLLSHGARIKADEVAAVAKKGNMSALRALVEAGADVNKGDPNPLVSAIALERVDMFEALLSWGAELNDDVRAACVEKAKQENLESMLDLLL